jgi:hypothetical protein
MNMKNKATNRRDNLPRDELTLADGFSRTELVSERYVIGYLPVVFDTA